MRHLPAALLVLASLAHATWAEDPGALAREVRDKGWIAYAARSDKGDWDLFLCRPDGSNVRNITHTPDANEGYPLFSRDGKRMLYRRIGDRKSVV
jgi:hypothetical protein